MIILELVIFGSLTGLVLLTSKDRGKEENNLYFIILAGLTAFAIFINAVFVEGPLKTCEEAETDEVTQELFDPYKKLDEIESQLIGLIDRVDTLENKK